MSDATEDGDAPAGERDGDRPDGEGRTTEARPDGGTAGAATDARADATLPTWLVRTIALSRREVLRVVRRPRNTVLPPIVTNALYVTVFGAILGARIGETAGVPYIQFVLPGLVGLGTIGQAFQNSAFSVFHGRWEEYIDALVASPIGWREQVIAYLVAAGVRGLLAGGAIFALGLVFTDVPITNPLALVVFLLLVVVLFGSLGIVGGLWADDFDQLVVFNQFLIQPLVFFGGVFYPLTDLPGVLRTASYLNPMVYMVSGIRYGVLGQATVAPTTAFVVLAGGSVLAIALAGGLLARGYGLTR